MDRKPKSVHGPKPRIGPDLLGTCGGPQHTVPSPRPMAEMLHCREPMRLASTARCRRAQPIARLGCTGAQPMPGLKGLGALPISRLSGLGAQPMVRLVAPQAQPMARLRGPGAEPMARLRGPGAQLMAELKGARTMPNILVSIRDAPLLPLWQIGSKRRLRPFVHSLLRPPCLSWYCRCD